MTAALYEDAGLTLDEHGITIQVIELLTARVPVS